MKVKKSLTKVEYSYLNIVKRQGGEIWIYLKTYRTFKFYIPVESDLALIHGKLVEIITSDIVEKIMQNPTSGSAWIHDETFVQRCYERWKCSNEKFRISAVNADYSFCSSYPSQFIVPAGVADQTLNDCANFREDRRIPILSYFYNKV
jgi:spore coat polysaccharide biosynthesis protein SpsF (cytidylyltransferase family)